jgi:hypothetical protein
MKLQKILFFLELFTLYKWCSAEFTLRFEVLIVVSVKIIIFCGMEDPEDGDNMSLWNVSKFLHYTAPQPIKKIIVQLYVGESISKLHIQVAT